MSMIMNCYVENDRIDSPEERIIIWTVRGTRKANAQLFNKDMATNNSTWTNQVDIGIARDLRWGKRQWVFLSPLLNIKNEGSPRAVLKAMCENVKAVPSIQCLHA